MASRINLFPHPPNQSVLSTPTDTASCTALVSLSVQVLHDSSFSPPPLSIRSFYTERHRILCRSRDSVRPSSAQFVRFPRATPTPLTAAPLSLSVLVGGVVVLPGTPCATPTLQLRCLCPSWFGGIVINTWVPSCTPNFAISVRPGGGGGFDPAPLAHPRLRRGPHSARKIQLTPRIPTQMSSVISPDTNLRSSKPG